MILGLAACVLFLGGAFRANRHLWAAVALAGADRRGIALFLTPSPDHFYRGLSGGDAASLPVMPRPFTGTTWPGWSRSLPWAAGWCWSCSAGTRSPDRQAAEYHACLLLIVAGLCLTGMANELVTLFLALELISIPTYVLLYLPRHDDAAQEAAMKYFLLSVFSSALLLFGFSYLYGLAGTTNMPAIARRCRQRARTTVAGVEAVKYPALVALVMVTAGFCFRITAVPFHFYAPDVYQGTPTPAAALLAFVPKVAGFVGPAARAGLCAGWTARTAVRPSAPRCRSFSGSWRP